MNGTAAGGGYELALACDEIVLIDDRSSAVSLPEVPLLAVLPGTGGLTRVVDKRHVRRDLADVFATRAEGVQGQQAVDVGPGRRASRRAAGSPPRSSRARPPAAPAARTARPTATGVALRPARSRTDDGDRRRYEHVDVRLDRELGVAEITVPARPARTATATGWAGWALAACRELDDAMLHLRFNEPELGTWVLRTTGDPAAVLAADELLARRPTGWPARSASTGRARSSGSTCRRARSWR